MGANRSQRPAASVTPAAVGTAAVGTGLKDARDDHVHATGAGTPSTQAFGDAAAVGSGPAAAMTNHKHAMPADPVTAHVAAGDPHTGYRLESADHSHATTGLQGGTVAHSALTGITATDHHAAPAAGPDADVTVDAAGAAGTAATFARSGHGHKVATSSAAPIDSDGTAASAGTSTTAPSRGDHRHHGHDRQHSVIAAADHTFPGDATKYLDGSGAYSTPGVGAGERGPAITAPADIGTAAVGTGVTDARADHVHATGAGTPSTQAFGDAAAIGSGPAAAMTNHKHAMPAAPTAASVGALADQGVISYLDGTVAAAPATPAAGKLRVYAKTGKVLAVKDDAGLETVFGGSSGVDWNKVVDEAGTSFASFTAATGTWSSNGTEIIQTDTTATWRRAKFNTLVALGFPWIIEAEMFIVSVAGSERRAGIGITDGTNANGLTVQIKAGLGVIVDQDNTQTFRSLTATINDTTWYKVRLVMGNGWLSVYLDGTLLANTPLMKFSAWDDNAEFVSLVSYNSSVKFRNLKTWLLSTNAPA